MNSSSIYAFWLSFKWQFLLQHHKLLNRWLIITTALFVLISVGMSIDEVNVVINEKGLTPENAIQGGILVLAVASYYAMTPYLAASTFDVAGRPEMRLYELMRPVSPLIKHASLWLLAIVFVTVGVFSALIVADVLHYLLFMLLGFHRQGLYISSLWYVGQHYAGVWALVLREGVNNANIQQIPADEMAKITTAASGAPIDTMVIVLKIIDILVEWVFWTLCLVWAKFKFKKLALLWGTLIYVAYSIVVHNLEQGVSAMQWSYASQWGLELIIATLCMVCLMRQCYLLHYHQPIK